MQEKIEAEIKTLTDQVKDWYDRTPWARKARQRLSEDLDTMVAQLDAATSELQERVRPYIDPPREEASQSGSPHAGTAPTMNDASGAPTGSMRDDRSAAGGSTTGEPSGSARLDASAE
jgi:hypothetical protein